MSLTDFASQQGVSIKEQESALRWIAIHAPVEMRLRSRRYLDDDVLIALGKIGEGVMVAIDDEERPHLRAGLDSSVFVISESAPRCYPLPLAIALDSEMIAAPLRTARPF